ncbi:MAG: tRNA pseudouridine(38-40) synthase TruA [Candidatus Eisenbacteria bacterium]|nr:tRNA pseudouridine(38-40) synthase TruA [Candidatus Eisenbacteria bacterium]
MRNIKLTVEYDGTAFSGWQAQRDLRTVQGEIEAKLRHLFGEELKVRGAGRTDAGCHAVGQVANFHTQSALPPDRIMRALNDLLEKDVRIKRAEEVGLDFDARRSAKRRVYEYIIVRGSSALWRRNAWCVPYEFDVTEMDLASKTLEGTLDFSSFVSSGSSPRSHVTQVFSTKWRKWKSGAIFRIEARSFLRGMVCNIVGTCMQIGRGKLGRERMRLILDAKKRELGGPKAPTHGLYLLEVLY